MTHKKILTPIITGALAMIFTASSFGLGVSQPFQLNVDNSNLSAGSKATISSSDFISEVPYEITCTLNDSDKGDVISLVAANPYAKSLEGALNGKAFPSSYGRAVSVALNAGDNTLVSHYMTIYSSDANKAPILSLYASPGNTSAVTIEHCTARPETVS